MAIEAQSRGAKAPVDIPAVDDGDGAKDNSIRKSAHLIWVDEGMPDGHELDHWMRVKWELEHKRHRAGAWVAAQPDFELALTRTEAPCHANDIGAH